MPEWGGPRPGAGRKPKEPGKTRVTLSTRVSERSSEQLRAYAKRTGKPLGEVLDEMVSFIGQQSAFEHQITVPAAPPQDPTPPVEPRSAERASESFLTQSFIDILPGGIVVTDVDLVIRLANDAFRTAVGKIQEDVRGRQLEEVLGPWLAQAVEPCREALELGEARAVVCSGDTPVKCWDVRICPIRDQHGFVHGVALYATETGPQASDPGATGVSRS